MKMTKVKLATKNGPVTVDAIVFGDWCAHTVGSIEGVHYDDGEWRVSHVPTGRSIMSVLDDTTKEIAVAVAKALGESDVDVTAKDAGPKVREIVRSVVHRGWPDWAMQAALAGWTAPAGWTP